MNRPAKVILTCSLFLPAGATILSTVLFLGLLAIGAAMHTSVSWFWDFWRSFGLIWALPMVLALGVCALMTLRRNSAIGMGALIGTGLICGASIIWLGPLIGWLHNGRLDDIKTIWLPASGIGAVAGALTGWAFGFVIKTLRERE